MKIPDFEPEDFDDIAESFDIDPADFDVEIEAPTAGPKKTRYIKPPREKTITYKKLKFKNAKRLAHAINFEALDRVFVVVDGSFIFGDFLEAFLVRYQAKATEMTLATLSMNQDNVDSLKNLMDAGYIEQLHLIISDFFYSHERTILIPYLYDHLDKGNRFQLSVCRTHCKIYQFKTAGGKHIVIHGSVNLRSSDNLEQFVIEDNKELYEFNKSYFEAIQERYKTINKSIKSRELWSVVKKAKK